MLIAALTFAASDARAQAVTLEYQQVVIRTMPGATAAFSLDPSRVGASARNGEVTLVGRAPGAASVIVVVGDRTESLQVLVADAPSVVLPGMWGADPQNAGGGDFEVRYGSDPSLLQGHLRFLRREGDRSTELLLGNAAPLDNAVGARFSIPVAAFTIRAPGRELTLMDRAVSNSALTVSRSNIRGLHVRQGPWQVHAGYSFFGNFEHLLLPTNKESVAGIGYRYSFTPRSSLTPNIYYFDVAADRRRTGLLGTLRYELAPATNAKIAAELGLGRAVHATTPNPRRGDPTLAVALDAEIDRPARRAWTRLRFVPASLPSLTTDQQIGRHIDAGWVEYGDKSSINATLASRASPRGEPGVFAYSSSVGMVDVQRRLTPAWAIHGGSGYAIFENAWPVASKVHSLTVPAGTSFSRQHVGVGVDYQFSRETTRNLAGHLVRADLNSAFQNFHFSIFGERQTHAPTVRQILTEIPWLQPMLDRLGLVAETPQQLADLLQTNAELSTYGYANSLHVDVTPMRTRLGGSAVWTGSGMLRPQLRTSTLFSRDALISGTALSALHSVSYSQRIGAATEVFLTWSALCHDGGSVPGTCRPVMLVSLRRTLRSAPGLLARRRGDIEGTVFQDDQGRGVYAEGMPVLAGVEVVLDGVRHTRTDRSGRFRFNDIPYGRHRVEARHRSNQPMFFTTPSPIDVDTGSVVNFGIGRARSSLRGIIRTDAGDGVSRVLVRVAGVDRNSSAHSADDGTFIVEGLPAGEYDVSVDASTVPAGYAVDALAAQRVRVEEATPGRAAFMLRPYRTVSGRVRLFNRRTGRYEALPETTVELRPLTRRAVTDANGLYTFRDLPAGAYTIVAAHRGREYVASVSIPNGPTIVRDMDVAVLPDSVTPEPSPARASEKPSEMPPRPMTKMHEGAGATSARGTANGATANAAPAATFTIQIAASPNERHARAMVAELKSAGHDAYLVEGVSSGVRGLYRVRVGRYSTRAEANRSALILEKALGWRLWVTTVDQGFLGTSRYASR